jgi:hypothetical protein
MDPIRRNITIKNVAGFHSLDLGFAAFDFESDERLRGFGIMAAQKEG